MHLKLVLVDPITNTSLFSLLVTNQINWTLIGGIDCCFPYKQWIQSLHNRAGGPFTNRDNMDKYAHGQ